MALPNNDILPGAAPLLWSNMKEAFDKINENFTALDLATGGTAVNLETLNTNVSPAYDNTYNLGDFTHRWKTVYTAPYQDVPGETANGLYVGSAHIKGIGSHVDLPHESTMDGVPIKEAFFNSVQVDNENRIDANTTAAPWGETLNLLSGSGMQLTVSSGADSITFDNTGILNVIASSGISATTISGSTTITNTGVRSLSSTTGLPSGRTPGAGINIDNSAGDNIKFTNTGVLSVEAGNAFLTVSTDSATGIVTITNAAPAGNTFRYVVVNGDTGSPIEADSVADILNIASGQGITLTKNTSTDTVTITINPVFDLKGSVFGDDSSILVDAVSNKIYAGNGFYGNLTGNVTGNLTGNVSGNASSASVATTIDITNTNGLTTVYYPTFTENRTTGQTLRGDVDLSYRTDTNTLTAVNFSGTLTGNIFTNSIDSADSSQIVVTPLMRFESDIVVENDLTVAERLTVKGSRVINLTELKSIVSLSTDFADFKTRIAAMV